MSRSKRPKRNCNDIFEVEELEDGTSQAIFLPSNDSGTSDSGSESELDFLVHSAEQIPKQSYSQILNEYDDNQSKLEPNHVYEWVIGEKRYEAPCNKLVLSDASKKKLQKLSAVELFELFFSLELQTYILDSTRSNGVDITLNELQTFLGIVITSIVNGRKSERDYWKTNELLRCEPIASAMSRNDFLKIKRNIKLNKPEDANNQDKVWRVRNVLEIFRKNIAQFGFFCTALAIDEMMVKFHGRAPALQFMPNKPERFGIKMWGICSIEGFLFDCDIYCGQGSNIFSADRKMKLGKCSVGSRVVMLMIQKLLTSVGLRKIIDYHLYFDNYFSNPDLLVHLKKLGLMATGTVRTDRVKEKNSLEKKAKRGTYIVKHEKNSGMNFITVMDSKAVSIISTAAGVTPLQSVSRYSKENHNKNNIPFPMAFSLYNRNMGGVDLHDAHCSNLLPIIRAKKWTWAMLCRFIQSSITNATVLYNLLHTTKKGTKEISLELAENYLPKTKIHKSVVADSKRNCENIKNCGSRTQKMCVTCNVYSCSNCFPIFHN